jgi:hypothetical protein
MRSNHIVHIPAYQSFQFPHPPQNKHLVVRSEERIHDWTEFCVSIGLVYGEVCLALRSFSEVVCGGVAGGCKGVVEG